MLSFLEICRRDPSSGAPSAITQATDNNRRWGRTLTTNHTEATEVTGREQYCVMNVGVWITKPQRSTLRCALKKKLLRRAFRAAVKLGSCSNGSNKVSLSSFPKQNRWRWPRGNWSQPLQLPTLIGLLWHFHISGHNCFIVFPLYKLHWKHWSSTALVIPGQNRCKYKVYCIYPPSPKIFQK